MNQFWQRNDTRCRKNYYFEKPVKENLLNLLDEPRSLDLKHGSIITATFIFLMFMYLFYFGSMESIAISNGSAWRAAVVEPSYVLITLVLSDDDDFVSIQFSLGRFNEISEMKSAVKNITTSIQSIYGHA